MTAGFRYIDWPVCYCVEDILEATVTPRTRSSNLGLQSVMMILGLGYVIKSMLWRMYVSVAQLR